MIDSTEEAEELAEPSFFICSMPNCTSDCVHGTDTIRKQLNPDKPQVKYEDHQYGTKKSAEVKTEHVLTEIVSEIEVPNCDGCGEKLSTIDTQRKEIIDLKKEIEVHKKEIEAKENKIRTFETDLQKAHDKMERALKSFNSDQIKKLEYPDGKIKEWSRETVQKAIQIYYACGTTGYKLLLRNGSPYPSISVLQRHLAKVDFSPGILYNFLALLKKKVALLDPKDRIVNLSCDEMVMQAMESYDTTDQCFIGHPTIPASNSLIEKRKEEGINEDDILATHAFNIMVCGMKFRFKQVIAYHFTDASFNPFEVATFLKTLIRELKNIGLTVRSLTMDNGPGNQAV